RPPAPSPFREATALRFRLDAPADVRLDVLDVLGRRVASVAGAYGAGEHAIPLDGADLAPGLYVVRLAAGGAVRTRTLVRSR
ncbi:MAG: T9SS type A sorting domain-containing protein, partial [Bacteroidota bacterium]